MELIINDIHFGNIQDVKEMKRALLHFIDIQYSPLEALKRNIKTFFDLIIEFCIEEKENKHKSEKGKLTRTITRIKKQYEVWESIRSKELFMKKYYSYLLSLEGLDTLRNFKIENEHEGLPLKDGEKQRLSKKHLD